MPSLSPSISIHRLARSGRLEDLSSYVLVGDLENSAKRLHGILGGVEFGDEVVALVQMVDLVGEPPGSPTINCRNLTARFRNCTQEAIDGLLDVALFKASIHDDHGLIFPHSSSSGLEPSGSEARRPPHGRGAGRGPFTRAEC